MADIGHDGGKLTRHDAPVSRIWKRGHSEMQQFSLWAGYVHLSLYRALKLTFPWDIGGISHDGTIKTSIGIGSMGKAVGVLTPTMFKEDFQL